MSDHIALVPTGELALGFALGACIGFAFFATLRRNVELYVTQRRLGQAVAVHVLRFVAVALAFAFVVRLGTPILLGACSSFLIVRWAMTRRARLSS